MSIQTPATADEIRDAISAPRPFSGPTVRGETIAVLTGSLRTHSAPLTGPLAPEVLRTMADYSEQYLTGGGRNRPAWHVVYYVTAPEPGAVNGARRVLAYITAEGHTAFTGSADDTGKASLPIAVFDAIVSGVQSLEAWKAESLATDRGDYPIQTAPDGVGMTFTLWINPMNGDPDSKHIAETFTDRATAYAARCAADRLGMHVPTSERQSAWIERAEVSR